MVKLKGTKTETKEFIIDVKDEELIKALRERIHFSRGVVNKEGDEIGYWVDESYDWSNYDNWKWYSISKDKNKIELIKSIEFIESYLKENK